MEDKGKGIRLLNIRKTEVKEKGDKKSSVTKATVYIPEGKEQAFLSKYKDFFNNEKIGKKSKRKNTDLISSIEDVSLAVLNSFWTGKGNEIPSDNKPVWCEIWLRYDVKVKKMERFLRILKKLLKVLKRCVEDSK